MAQCLNNNKNHSSRGTVEHFPIYIVPLQPPSNHMKERYLTVLVDEHTEYLLKAVQKNESCGKVFAIMR